MKEKLLGVNVDHIATIRQARGGNTPSPILAAKIAIQAGADQITMHLREDRRHIQDEDIFALKKENINLNLEMAATNEMVNIALKVMPKIVCIVPEKRQELTTEGGLDVIGNFLNLKKVLFPIFKKIKISLFIDPNLKQIEKAKELGVDAIEIHTGDYANATNNKEKKSEFAKIKEAAVFAKSQGLIVNAGHGLDYENITAIAQIKEISEFNIGHAIVSKSVFVGFFNAVKEIIELINPKLKDN